MHERYGYLYIALGIIIAIVDIRTSPMFLFVSIIDMMIYSHYLFNMTINWRLLGVINIICWLIYLAYGLVISKNKALETSSKQNI